MEDASFLQVVRMKQFERVYGLWRAKEIDQEEAGLQLQVSARTFRRYVVRYEKGGKAALVDGRLGRPSSRKASDAEVSGVAALYRDHYPQRNMYHFYEAYKERHNGKRSYGWVRNCLLGAGVVKAERLRGPHRMLRDRREQEGAMLHQDASKHLWVPGKKMWDLVVTMDDATGKIYSAFFIEEEGTRSSFLGVREVLLLKGVFASLYTDRGSHYWTTPEAGGKVDKANLTQFGRAMRELGVQMIAAYSPQARGRSERMFKTLQDRLPVELAERGITEMEEANKLLITI